MKKQTRHKERSTYCTEHPARSTPFFLLWGNADHIDIRRPAIGYRSCATDRWRIKLYSDCARRTILGRYHEWNRQGTHDILTPTGFSRRRIDRDCRIRPNRYSQGAGFGREILHDKRSATGARWQ